MEEKEDVSQAGAAILAPLPAAPAALAADLLAGEIAAASAYRRRAKADNTMRAYESDWHQFESWCAVRNPEPLPARPEAVATYLASLAQAGKADSTIGRHLAAIGWRHRQAGEVPPTARGARMVIVDTFVGIRREQRARPSATKVLSVPPSLPP